VPSHAVTMALCWHERTHTDPAMSAFRALVRGALAVKLARDVLASGSGPLTARIRTMSRFAELAGSRIHYDEAGQGDAVLLLHGLALDLRMWDDQVPALAHKVPGGAAGLHGFGKSSGVTGPFSHAELISQLLAHLGIERAHVVGLSLAGSWRPSSCNSTPSLRAA